MCDCTCHDHGGCPDVDVLSIRAALMAHLMESSDPCQDRGVEWPCDVAQALYPEEISS